MMKCLYFAIIDFEANCTQKNATDHEVCEFPCLLYSVEKYRVVDVFRKFVRPVFLNQLSHFIKDLTHITDLQIRDHGEEWSDVLLEFEKWLFQSRKGEDDVTTDNCLVLTCGSWDMKTMLPRQLMITKTKLSIRMEVLFRKWIDIKEVFVKQQFPKTYKPWKRYMQTLDKMLETFDLEIVGQLHSGIDDCKNIAQIVTYMLLNDDDKQQIGNNENILNLCCHNTRNYWYQQQPPSLLKELPPPSKRGQVICEYIGGCCYFHYSYDDDEKK